MEKHHIFTFTLLKTYEPAHDKTFNKLYLTSTDYNRPVHPPNIARALVYLFE